MMLATCGLRAGRIGAVRRSSPCDPRVSILDGQLLPWSWLPTLAEVATGRAWQGGDPKCLCWSNLHFEQNADKIFYLCRILLAIRPAFLYSNVMNHCSLRFVLWSEQHETHFLHFCATCFIILVPSNNICFINIGQLSLLLGLPSRIKSPQRGCLLCLLIKLNSLPSHQEAGDL